MYSWRFQAIGRFTALRDINDGDEYCLCGLFVRNSQFLAQDCDCFTDFLEANDG